MRYFLASILILSLAGCDVVGPTLLTGPVAGDASTDAVINASVSVLQQEGYTVITADRNTGVVTTDWRAESSYAGQIFLDTSRRTRISLVLDFFTDQIQVQMTKQKKEGESPWRNDDLSDNDRSQMQIILNRVQERALAIQSQLNSEGEAGSGV